MTLRTSTQEGRNLVHVEVARPDELPAGVPAPARPAAARDGAGKFTSGPGTAAVAREGARARHESRQLRSLLGLHELPDGHPVAPYRAMAAEWRDGFMQELAAVGGGRVGAGAASIASSAALELAASRVLFDVVSRAPQHADVVRLATLAARLADSSRQNILACHELVAREAAARPRDEMAELNRRLGIEGPS